MMSKEGYEYWNNMETISKSLETRILREGVKTGSKIFGGFKPSSSDIDILLPPKYDYLWDDLFHARKGWYENEEYRGEEFRALYIKCRFTKYPVNLIIMFTDEAFQKWKTTTDIMKCIRNNTQIDLTNKEIRIELFERLESFIDLIMKKEVNRAV